MRKETWDRTQAYRIVEKLMYRMRLRLTPSPRLTMTHQMPAFRLTTHLSFENIKETCRPSPSSCRAVRTPSCLSSSCILIVLAILPRSNLLYHAYLVFEQCLLSLGIDRRFTIHNHWRLLLTPAYLSGLISIRFTCLPAQAILLNSTVTRTLVYRW